MSADRGGYPLGRRREQCPDGEWHPRRPADTEADTEPQIPAQRGRAWRGARYGEHDRDEATR